MSNRRERRQNMRTNKKVINKLVAMCMGNPAKGIEEMSKMGVDPAIQNQIMQAAFFKRAAKNPELMELAMKANEEKGMHAKIMEEQVALNGNNENSPAYNELVDTIKALQHEDISPEQA